MPQLVFLPGPPPRRPHRLVLAIRLGRLINGNSETRLQGPHPPSNQRTRSVCPDASGAMPRQHFPTASVPVRRRQRPSVVACPPQIAPAVTRPAISSRPSIHPFGRQTPDATPHRFFVFPS